MSTSVNKRAVNQAEIESSDFGSLRGFVQEGHTIKDGVKFFYALAESGNIDIIRTNQKIASVVNTSRIGSTATLRVGEEILKSRNGVVATGERVFEQLCDSPVTMEEFQSVSGQYLETLYTLFSQVKGVVYDLNNPVHAEFLQGADSFARFLLNLPEDSHNRLKETFPPECNAMVPIPQYTAPALEMQPQITAKLADERLPVDANSDSFEQSVYLTADICTTSVLLKMFLIAAANGHEQLLTLLHPYISNTEPVMPNGDTALCVATRNRQVNCVRELIRLGFQVNHTGAYGCTPLVLAVNTCDVIIVGHLLESRADPNILSASQNGPIHIAAIKGDADILRLLLVSGAIPTSLSSNRQTPLELATNSDCRRILLNNLPDYMTRTATEIANSKIYYNIYPDQISFNASIDNAVNYIPRQLFDSTTVSVDVENVSDMTSDQLKVLEEERMQDFISKNYSQLTPQKQYMSSIDHTTGVGNNAYGFNDSQCPTPFKQLLNGALPRLLWSAVDTENPFTITSKTLVEDETMAAKGNALARSVITEDSLLTSNFGVYPYDHLTPGERVVVLSMVLFSLVPRKPEKTINFPQYTLMHLLTTHEHLPVNVPPANIMYESALYVLFKVIFRRIHNEVIRSRVYHSNSDNTNSATPSLLDDRLRWRSRCYAAFEHISAGKPSHFGLEISCENMNIWSTVLDILACGLFGSAYWEKRKLFALPNPLQRYQAYPHIQRLPHGYFAYTPPPVFMSLLIYMKQCAFASFYVADINTLQNICLCYDCICKQTTESRSREIIKGLVNEEEHHQQWRNKRLTSAKTVVDLKKKKKPVPTTTVKFDALLKSNYQAGVLTSHSLRKCLDANAMHGQQGLGLGGILAQYQQVSDGIHSMYVHPDILTYYTYMITQQKVWQQNQATMTVWRDQALKYFDSLPHDEKLQLISFDANQHPPEVYMYPNWEQCRFGLECHKRSHQETDSLLILSNKISLSETLLLNTNDDRFRVMFEAACQQVSTVNVLLNSTLAHYIGLPARPHIDTYLTYIREHTKHDKLQQFIDNTMCITNEIQGNTAPINYTYSSVHNNCNNVMHTAPCTGSQPNSTMQLFLDYALVYDSYVSQAQIQLCEQVLTSMNQKSEDQGKTRSIENFLRSETELITSLYNDGYARKYAEYTFFLSLQRKMSENFLKYKNEESARLIAQALEMELQQDLDKKKKKKKEKGVSRAVENSLYANLHRPEEEEEEVDPEVVKKAAAEEKKERELEEERLNAQIRNALEQDKKRGSTKVPEKPRKEEMKRVVEEKKEPVWVPPKYTAGDLLPVGLKFPVDFNDPVNEINVLPDRWWLQFTDGYVFPASTDIINEMLGLGVVATAVKHLPEMQGMHTNSAIFLYNVTTRAIVGVFQLENKAISTIYPKAFQNSKNFNYGAQVQMKAFYLFPPIVEREFKKFAFLNSPSTTNNIMFKKISNTETQQLQSTMRAKRLVPTPSSMKAEAEKERLEKELKEKQERQKLEREQREKEKKERIEREKIEKERLRVEREKAEKERLDKEKLEKEKSEKVRVEREKKEKIERERQEKAERQEREKEQRERDRQDKLHRQQQQSNVSSNSNVVSNNVISPTVPVSTNLMNPSMSPISPLNPIPSLPGLPVGMPPMYGDYSMYPGSSNIGTNPILNNNMNNFNIMYPNNQYDPTNFYSGFNAMPNGYSNNMNNNMMNMMNMNSNMNMNNNNMMNMSNPMKPPQYTFWSDPAPSASPATTINPTMGNTNNNNNSNNATMANHFWVPPVVNTTVNNANNNTTNNNMLPNFFASPQVVAPSTMFENIWPTAENANIANNNNNDNNMPNQWEPTNKY